MVTKILKFEASWCTPCASLSRTLEQMKDEISVPIEIVDVDDDPKDLCRQYKVRGIPVLVFLDGNTEKSRLVGACTVSKILDNLK